MTGAGTEVTLKAVVRRLVDEVMNARRLDVLHGRRALHVLGDASGRLAGRAATGRRFEDVDEVYFFIFDGGRIAAAWGIEDTLDRLRQLGLAGSS